MSASPLLRQRFDATVRSALMASAYLSITEEMGPSEQLLAMVDYDGKLQEEMGLESINFTDLSLSARHELLATNLNPEALFEVALESLKGNAESLKTKASAGLFRNLIGALRDKIVDIRGLKKVISVNSFHLVMSNFEHLINMETQFVEAIPDNFEIKAWAKFTHHFHDELQENYHFNSNRAVLSFDNAKKHATAFEQSGWTAEELRSQHAHLQAHLERLVAMEAKFLPKLERIEHEVETEKADLQKHITKKAEKYHENMTDHKKSGDSDMFAPGHGIKVKNVQFSPVISMAYHAIDDISNFTAISKHVANKLISTLKDVESNIAYLSRN